MIAAVVLAAGSARRFGGGKLTAPLHGRPLVAHVLDAVLRARGVDRRFVVVRDDDRDVAALVAARPALTLARCADADRGLSASLRDGLAAARGADAVVVVLGDGPALAPAAIERLIAARRAGPAAPEALRPRYAGARGPAHPVLLEAHLLDAADALAGDRGFGPLLAGRRVGTVDCRDLPDPGDVDEPADLVALAGRMPPHAS